MAMDQNVFTPWVMGLGPQAQYESAEKKRQLARELRWRLAEVVAFAAFGVLTGFIVTWLTRLVDSAAVP